MGDSINLCNPERQNSIYSRSLVVPAGFNTHIETYGNPLAYIYLEDKANELAQLRQQASCKCKIGQYDIAHELNTEKRWLSTLDKLLAKNVECNDALSEINDCFLKTNIDQQCISDTRVLTAIQEVRRNPTQNISVSEIAKYVCLSQAHFIELFKKSTGINLRRFRLWEKIKYSTQLISAGQPLNDIALECGFSDYAHFSRIFKELIGVSPSVSAKFVTFKYG